MASEQHRQGAVRKLAATSVATLTLVLTAAACTEPSAPDSGQESTPASASASAAPGPSGAQDGPPSIGAGDPMLGATDGEKRPALPDIPTDQLDSTNALELAERFRRTFEDESLPADQWVTTLKSMSDPTFAVSLNNSSRGYFEARKSTDLRVDGGYALGAAEPYATVIASDTEGNDLWKAKLAITLSAADPSIGTWSVVSVDWLDPSLAEGKMIPLTEDTRNNVRVTATFGSAGVFQQSVGEDPANRFAILQNYLRDPQHAAARGKPVPDRDVAVEALDAKATYFVTPHDSENIWVEVEGGFRALEADGTYGAPTPVTFYVQMVPDGDTYAGNDVYTEAEYKAATGQ